jgi:hypothetical protein
MQSREWCAIFATIVAIAGFSRASSVEAVEIERAATKASFLRGARPYPNEGANEILVLRGRGFNRIVVASTSPASRPATSATRA